jgi:DNA-binding response OmpR family regulator
MNTSASNTLEIRSVLLLDDDVELVEMLKLVLEAQNFFVTTATNGVEGLHEIMSFDFDVIICDLMMPKLPGDMFYLAVQRTKPQLCGRFIFITGHANDAKFTAFLAKTDGIALYKPVKIEDLLRAIESVLRKSKGAAGTQRS